MSRKQMRLVFIMVGIAALWIVIPTIIIYVLNDNIVFSYSPTDIIQQKIKPGQNIRLAGLVAEGSVKRQQGLRIEFTVSDGNGALPVVYTGIVPDLFGEKQGVVVEGQMDETGVFRAETVLAKHDEKYMPREVVDALKKQGVWQGDKPQTLAPAQTPPQAQPQPQAQTKTPPQKALSQ